MKTDYVLVDLENVQPKSLEKLNRDPFKVMVFVGASQKTLSFDIVKAVQKLGSRACYLQATGNGKNALDFHLVYYLGRYAVQEPDAMFWVVSRDTGFDPVIQHVTAKGIRCQRVVSVEEIANAVTAGSESVTSAGASSPTTKPPVPEPSAHPQAPSVTPKQVAAKPAVAKKATSPKPAAAKPTPTKKKTTTEEKSKHVIEPSPAAFLTHLRNSKAVRPQSLKALKIVIVNFYRKTLPPGGKNAIIDAAVKAGLIAVMNDKVSYPGG